MRYCIIVFFVCPPQNDKQGIGKTIKTEKERKGKNAYMQQQQQKIPRKI